MFCAIRANKYFKTLFLSFNVKFSIQLINLFVSKITLTIQEFYIWCVSGIEKVKNIFVPFFIFKTVK